VGDGGGAVFFAKLFGKGATVTKNGVKGVFLFILVRAYKYIK